MNYYNQLFNLKVEMNSLKYRLYDVYVLIF